MTTAFILIVSGVLIGAGISIIWRDVRKKRRSTFVSQRDCRPPSAPDEVEITISHRPLAGRGAGAADFEPRAGGLSHAPAGRRRRDRRQLAASMAAGDRARGVLSRSSSSGRRCSRRSPPASTRSTPCWRRRALSLGAPGEPSWSYKNRGYGAYRRLLLRRRERGVAPARASPATAAARQRQGAQGRRAQINASPPMPAEGLNARRASDLLSECLKPAAQHALQAPRRAQTATARRPPASRPGRASTRVVAAALKATNGALAQAGARLVPLAPAAWERELRRHRMTLAVEVNGDDVARMHIERLPHEMEVAVGVREAQLIDLGRRRRVPVDGMTIHALAELIASCAWPAIARFRETRRQA